MRLISSLLAGAVLIALGACSTFEGLMPGGEPGAEPPATVAAVAPGAPGETPTWVNAAKTGAGASYEAYVDGQYRDGGDHGRGFGASFAAGRQALESRAAAEGEHGGAGEKAGDQAHGRLVRLNGEGGR